MRMLIPCPKCGEFWHGPAAAGEWLRLVMGAQAALDCAVKGGGLCKH